VLTGSNRNLASFSPEKVEELKTRLWSKTVPSDDGCILFTGAGDGNGYGKLCVQEGTRTVYPKAHVLSWLLTHGSIPGRLDVCHSCNVKNCVNPSNTPCVMDCRKAGCPTLKWQRYGSCGKRAITFSASLRACTAWINLSYIESSTAWHSSGWIDRRIEPSRSQIYRISFPQL